jgi:solute:Na+ symporter, SSS family
MDLPVLDIIVIVAYMAAISLIGVYFSKRQVSRDEYFLGDRKVHWLLAGGSIMATLLSALTYLSAPGEMIRYGFGFFVGLLALPLVIPVVSRILIPLLRQLPMTSAYEYLQERFDGRVRKLASAAFVFRTVLWMGLIIYTASFAFAEITGFGIYGTILIVGTVTTFYTTMGGMRTVIWTDNLQLWILLGGAITIPVFIGFSIGSGPVGWWELFGEAGRTDIQVFSWDPTVRITLVGVLAAQFFWNICTHGGDQVAVQRYLATDSVASARRSLWVFAVFNIAIILLLMFCGLAIFAFYAHESGLPVDAFQQQIEPQADRLMPRFILDKLPSGVSGLLLAAILAAAMSSLSAAMNSVSGVVITDWSQFLGPQAENLRVEKFVTFASGGLGLAAALAVAYAMETSSWNLVELIGRVNHLFVGPIAVLFFGGMLFRRIGTPAALAAFAAATFTSVFVAFGKEWFGLERGISFIWVVPIPFMAGLLIAAIVGRLLPPPGKKIDHLTIADLGRAGRNNP